MTAPPRQTLPECHSFPVSRPDPAMEALFWTWDQMHFPYPLTPLTAGFEARAFSEGAAKGSRGDRRLSRASPVEATFRSPPASGTASSLRPKGRRYAERRRFRP